MIPVLFIPIHYVFLTLSLPLYNFQKKTSVQDNVKWNLLFSTSSFDTFCIYSCTLVNILCGFFKVKLNWCIVTFCNLWVVGLKLSRYVVIYISFFWKAELCTYSTFNIFKPPSLIILPAILLNLQVILYGDQIPWNKQENVIVICNHQSSGTNFLKRQLYT